MPYIVNRSNGTVLTTINDGVVDVTTSIGLLGRNYTGYGEIQNENFVYLLENFANSNPPAKPILGQAWYDTVNQKLNTYNGSQWVPVGSAVVSLTEPPASLGSFWMKPDSQQLYVYSTQGWTLIGPEAALGFGKTRLESRVVQDVDGNNHAVIAHIVDNNVIGITSNDEFTVASVGEYFNFFEIYKGINLNKSVTSSIDTVITLDTLVLSDNINTFLNGKILTPAITGRTDAYKSADGNIYLDLSNNKWRLYFLAGAIDTTIYGNNISNDPTLINQWSSTAIIVTPTSGPTITRSTVSNTVTNLVKQYNFVGNLKGNAETSSRFETARTINGIRFDGSSDIDIFSTTANNLIRGDYLIGEDFDGAVETTWSVDATSENIIGKVVVRDSGGDFAAGRITADEFIGLHKGNVDIDSGISYFNRIVCVSIEGADLQGNAATAGALNPGRTINGVLFTGSENITVPAAAGTLTGPVLAANVLESSLTTVGNLNSLTVSNPGISIGSSGQLNLSIVGVTPTIADTSGQGLTLAVRDTSQADNLARLRFLNAANSLSLGGANGPSVLPQFNGITNLGAPAFKFNNIYTNTLHGIATTAQYADLAENYLADKVYKPGTVLEFGGENEVTLATTGSKKVAGIVSENPAYLMNSNLKGKTVVALALIGRVKCRVKGPIKKGDMLISAGKGFAKAEENPKLGTVIGKAIEDFTQESGVVEVVVGKL